MTVFKHSISRRADGDDVVIWVHNSFEEQEAPVSAPVSKRYLWGGKWDPGVQRWMCEKFEFNHDTTANSPTTGGVHEIRSWASTRYGGFTIQWGNPSWQNFIIAGSNGGTNARFDMKVDHVLHGGYVSTDDIRQLAEGTLERYQRNYSGKWRVGGWGATSCWSGHWRAQFFRIFNKFYWVIGPAPGRVPHT